MPPAVDIRRVSLEDILPLRQEILHPSLSLNALRQPYDAYTDTFHLAAFDKSEIIGCVSLTHESFRGETSHSLPTIQLQLHKLAVKTSYQGQGIGKILMRTLIGEIIADHKVLPPGDHGLLHFDARMNAVPFYKSIGMVVLDPNVFIKGVEELEHLRMGRYLPG